MTGYVTLVICDCLCKNPSCMLAYFTLLHTNEYKTPRHSYDMRSFIVASLLYVDSYHTVASV